MPKIVIGIPTFQRPQQLKRLALSIAKISVPLNSSISILIANNDADLMPVENILTDLKSTSFPFNSHHTRVKERGISFSRNAILTYTFEKCKADILVMVDDDEVVSKHWLCEMLSTQVKFDADIVGGLKLPKFTKTPEKWMQKNDVYFYAPTKKNGLCSRLVSTDNLLITKQAYVRFGCPKFDPEFALTGGGDTEYLHRLSKMGARLAFSQNAITYEIVPKERMSFEWAKQRSRRIGIGLARIHVIHEKGFTNALRMSIKIFFILIVAGLLFLSLALLKQKRIKYQLICIKQIGKIEGLFGKKVFPYQYA